MFWVGLIVGVVIGIGIMLTICYMGYRVLNIRSLDEMGDIIDTLTIAGENRESVITVTHNDEVIGICTLSEM